MTPTSPTRRDFLKLSGAALLGLALGRPAGWAKAAGAGPLLGRVQATSLIVRAGPSFGDERLGSLKRDTLVEVAEQVYGGAEGDYNRVWYRLADGGWVYSGWIQAVETVINPAAEQIPPEGRLGCITVPYADSAWSLSPAPVPGPRLYFGSNHWFTARVADPVDGSPWLQARDPSNRARYFTRPEWVHLFSEAELAPLSPHVPGEDKQIEIYLDRQLLVACEWGTPVYRARVSTGQPGYETPTGWFRTFHKRPAYHMVGGADDAHVFDLPGVPWDTYFTEDGAAMHGTYWHNDFGHPHSHGCVNLRPDDARWIYRWTLPTVPAGEDLRLEPGNGTRVRITEN